MGRQYLLAFGLLTLLISVTASATSLLAERDRIDNDSLGGGFVAASQREVSLRERASSAGFKMTNNSLDCGTEPGNDCEQVGPSPVYGWCSTGIMHCEYYYVWYNGQWVQMGRDCRCY